MAFSLAKAPIEDCKLADIQERPYKGKDGAPQHARIYHFVYMGGDHEEFINLDKLPASFLNGLKVGDRGSLIFGLVSRVVGERKRIVAELQAFEPAGTVPGTAGRVSAPKPATAPAGFIKSGLLALVAAGALLLGAVVPAFGETVRIQNTGTPFDGREYEVQIDGTGPYFLELIDSESVSGQRLELISEDYWLVQTLEGSPELGWGDQIWGASNNQSPGIIAGQSGPVFANGLEQYIELQSPQLPEPVLGASALGCGSLLAQRRRR
jgi:hypothetical protein